VRWEGTLRVPESGRYAFGLATSGSCRLYLDNKLIAGVLRDADAPSRWVSRADVVHRELDADNVYEIRVDYVHPADVRRRTLYIQSTYAPEPDVRPQRAVQLAAEANVAIVFAGMPRGFESEGHDRPHMRLPGPQDELIRAVARANERTIVVLNCGAPVEMPWIDDIAALLLAYYPGQEGGTAVTNLLLGDADPSGRLSVTYPRRYEDNPTYINYPGTREVRYGEGIFVGYRYYDQVGAEPLFPFGFGLSYTAFSYGELQVAAEAKAGDLVEVSLTVENTGARAGKEVVQLYVRDVESSLARPPKELKGFAKVSLEPGERTNVQFDLDRRAFAFYDPQRAEWIVESGTFEILLGGSSRDIRATAKLRLVD
jgi:beta-glucosidase